MSFLGRKQGRDCENSDKQSKLITNWIVRPINTSKCGDFHSMAHNSKSAFKIIENWGEEKGHNGCLRFPAVLDFQST